MKDIRKIKKYANTLINVSNKLDYDIKDISKNLSLFHGILRKIPELRYLLFSKRISLDAKTSAIRNIFSSDFRLIEIEFIFILLTNNHMGLLKDIIEKLNSMIQSNSNVKNIHVTSFKKIEGEDKNEIISSIKNRFNIDDDSKTSFSTDKTLQGGIKIRIGNKIIDGSISTKLKKIKESLLSI